MTKGVAHSDDYRELVLNMCFTMSKDEIITKTGISRRVLNRVIKDFHEVNTAARVPYGGRGGPRPALNRRERRYLEGLLRKAPDAYLDELREQLENATGKSVSDSTIWKTLDRNGFTLKRITREAYERNEVARAEYRVHWGLNYTLEQTVTVDESSFDRRTALRGRAWALKGRRAYRKCFFVRGRRYSVLPAMSSSGMIHHAIVEGSFTAERFREFIEGLLDKMQPFPHPNSVIVMDNARIHKDPDLLKMIEDRGCKYCFLPPYSPDYNPIELAFSAIKHYVKRAGVLLREDLGEDGDDTYVYHHLIDAIYSVTPEAAQGFFFKCGYL